MVVELRMIVIFNSGVLDKIKTDFHLKSASVSDMSQDLNMFHGDCAAAYPMHTGFLFAFCERRLKNTVRLTCDTNMRQTTNEIKAILQIYTSLA